MGRVFIEGSPSAKEGVKVQCHLLARLRQFIQ